MSAWPSVRRLAAVGVAWAPGWLLVGCGGADGNKLFRVSGSVTFAGQPVPAGQVSFLPDASRGNGGPPGHPALTDGPCGTATAGPGTNRGPPTPRTPALDDPPR